MQYYRRMTILIFVLLLTACASFPPNPPLFKYDPAIGYRFDLLEQGANSDELFVILTFSGGGMRAAALSYGVMEALRDTLIVLGQRKVTLLDEVDVISSISGGSFPAAYYALYGLRIFDEFPDKFLYRPIQSNLLKQLFSPVNLLKLASPSFGRSDLAAEFYHREVFDSGTYADVITRGHRPFVILNATDMSKGTQFSFVQDQFDLLCSNLNGVPLARAAAASSAFPGGLTPLTFQNYAGSCQYRQPKWVELAIKDHTSRVNPRRTARAEERLSLTAEGAERRNYIHLIDGGVADNIGLRGPLTAITSTNYSWSVLQMLNKKKVKMLVIITVNSATNPATKRDKTPNVPGFVDVLTAVATVPLDNYSFDTMELLAATAREFNQEAQFIDDCKKLAAMKGEQCALDIPMPHRVELFPVQVAFEYIGEAEERAWFKNLPTTLELPRETIDRLRSIGRKLLSEDPNFKRLMQELQGCITDEKQGC